MDFPQKPGEIYQRTLGRLSGVVRDIGGLHLSPYMGGWLRDQFFEFILF